MSAIAGMNLTPGPGASSGPGVLPRQQPPITSASPPPFILQGHRISAPGPPVSPGPGVAPLAGPLTLPTSPMQTDTISYSREKYIGERLLVREADHEDEDQEHDQAAQGEHHHIEMHQQLPIQHRQEASSDNDNLFENNSHHDQEQDRAESQAKDATLEPESDDELFINEGPALGDDSDQETSECFPRDNFDDSSNFVDEEEHTYDSPGVRDAFSEGYAGANQDQDASRSGSTDNGRKNKRKQMKPRNIVYSMNDNDSDNEGGQAPERENSPMDLSVAPRPGQEQRAESDSDSESSQAANVTESKPKPGGLSVVRPEILFGDSRAPSSGASNNSSDSQTNPLSLLSNLSGFPPGLNLLNNLKMLEEGTGIKNEFKDLLKLFGVSSEVTENLIPNTEQRQDQPGTASPGSRDHVPAFSHPTPGMLSAALQGNLPPVSHQPPTPPRTPQGNKFDAEARAGGGPGAGLMPKMPSLFALQGLQHQMLSGAGGGAAKPASLHQPLTSQLNKQGLQGLPPGMLGVHPMAAASGLPPGHPGLPPLPPHLLAAQRVHGMIPGKPIVTTDYTRYFKRFGSSLECGFNACKDMNYREHFHCAVPMCKGKDFAKKEEMIRHSKWHQKMDEALKYGFRRVTPMDDCSDQFIDCTHNKKQTHYHCIQSDGCDKVYISTSDVQMHFNYHRKDNAIQREGFLRFRGAEDCGSDECMYRNQKTTHFHCNRSGCQYTFKNKADMEKHKNYHMKDEQLNKDGFKKFMKHEPCGFLSCKFSRTHNHIHCIRSNCDYVLHSSGQLFSHKRKHERKDNELAYRKYKLAQSMIPGQNGGGMPSFPGLPPSSPDNSNSMERPPSSSGSLTSGSSSPPLLPIAEPNGQVRHNPQMSLAQPLPPSSGYETKRETGSFMPIPQSLPDDVWQQYLLRFEQDEGCGFQECEVEDTEHFHCKDEGCETVFRNEEGVREHGRSHAQQDAITDQVFTKVDPEEPGSEEACPAACPYKGKEVHYHCKWENCAEIILSTDASFRRLDHYKIHEYSKKWNMSQRQGMEPISMTMTTNIDAMFKRKRGRPPKNRVIEVFDRNSPFNTSSGAGPQAVFTSFKLPKPGPPAPEFSPSPLQAQTSSPFGFSLGSLRPPMPHFTTTTQFQTKTELGPESPMSLGGALRHGEAAKKELCESPTAPNVQEDVQKIQENNNNNQSETEESHSDEVTPPKNQGLIKARGTYFPLTAFPTHMPQGSVMRDSPPPASDMSVLEETSPPVSMKSKATGLNFMVSVGRAIESGDNALAKLLQASQEMGFANSDKSESNPNKQLSDERKLPVSAIRDLSPISSQARAPPGPGDSHLLSSPLGRQTDRESPSPRILGSAASPGGPSSSPHSLPTSPVVSNPQTSAAPGGLNFGNPFGLAAGRNFLSSPGLLPPGMNPFFPHAGMMLANPFQRFPGDPRMAAGLFDPNKPFARPGWPGVPGMGGAGASQKRSSPMDLDDDIALTQDQKKLRLQTSMRMLKDEPVPEGYSRFRFNEDCHFSNCNYREHQTHFHCMRKDCNYRFCDKTRFVQHTARHERLDTLCGDEFQGFRGVPCGREECELNVLHNTSANQKSSSHFHCLKCDYYCTDTNKVVAHRRQHQKLDSILAAGFEKFTPTQYCATPGCSHNGKQTHYHCRKCQYAVLGLSQMEAHKYRHMNEDR